MINFLKKRLINNDKGVTLVEMLVGLAIFMGIVIPLSSLYMSQIKFYYSEQVKTQLDRQVDYVLSNIMNEIQDASYFDLYFPKNSVELAKSEEHKIRLAKILTLDITGHHMELPPDENFDAQKEYVKDYSQGVTRYQYSYSSNGNGGNEYTSLIERKIYQFLPLSDLTDSSGLYQPFIYDTNAYIVDGLFKLEDEQADTIANNKKLTILLVIAPKSLNNSVEYQGQKASFQSIDEVLTELQELNKTNQPSYFIRVLKTEIDITNMKRG